MPSEPSEPRRLHPASPLFRVGGAARALLLPGLFVLFVSRGGNFEVWLMLLFVPTVIGTLANYWSYRYRFAEDELVVREGIISRNERHIPYARIQNIDLVQNPVHRMLGVAEVRIETAGGQKPEAIMKVLALEAVEQMRGRVFSGRAPEAPSASPPPAVHRLELKDVLLFGFIANRGMVLVAAAFGILWQTDSFERVMKGAGRDEVEGVFKMLAGSGTLTVVFAVAATVLAFLLTVRLLSLVWALVKFYGFTLTRNGETLRAEFGLLTRVTK